MLPAVKTGVLTVGVTIICLLSDTVPHDPPDVVKVSVAVPEYTAGGVHVAFKSFAEGLKVPPTGVVHIPPIALPSTEPPSDAEVPP